MITSRSHRIARRRTVRGLALLAGGMLAVGVAALPASAHHADEKVEVSKTTDLTDGDTLKVTFSGFTPGGKPAKVVIAGQGELTTIPDKLNFDEYGSAPSVEVAADGTGSFDFVATSDHGTVQDGSTLNCLVQQCWVIVVQEPFLPQPNYDSVPVTFVGGSVAAPTTEAPATPTTVTDVAETTAAPAVTEAPATTVASEVTSTTAADTTTESASSAVVDDADDEGGSGALYAIIAAVVVVLGVGGFVIARRKPPVG